MQIRDVGRNDSCPCGSGNKYKKCCLGGNQVAPADGLDVAALVTRAIEQDDWGPVHEALDPVLEIFEAGGVLEFVRFRDDLVDGVEEDDAGASRACSGGWLRWCEQEIADVLQRYTDFEPRERDALRLASHLVRRFGARSPVVEEVAAIQLAERDGREEELDAVMARDGLTDEALPHARELIDWLDRTTPALVPFCDWFAMLDATVEQASELWRSGVAARFCDACLQVLQQSGHPDARYYAALAQLALFERTPEVGPAITRRVGPVCATDDERALYGSFLGGPAPAPRILGQIIVGAETRGDYAGVSILRGMVARRAARVDELRSSP